MKIKRSDLDGRSNRKTRGTKSLKRGFIFVVCLRCDVWRSRYLIDRDYLGPKNAEELKFCTDTIDLEKF